MRPTAERGKAREHCERANCSKGAALITSTSIEARAKATEISALPQRGAQLPQRDRGQRAEAEEDSACSSQQDCPRISGLVNYKIADLSENKFTIIRHCLIDL